jgi:hypothetical protein
VSRTFNLALVAVVFLPAIAGAATILVPEQQPTIQAGINAANPGDTVSVASGTYTVSMLNFQGKSITLLGRNGSASTIIQPAANNTLLLIQNVGGSSAAVDGFTFRNGRASLDWHGGCIAIRNSSPTIRNSRFENCQTIQGNAGSSGGAIKVTENGNPLIQNNVFHNNRSYSQGGAIHMIEASGRVIGNTFTGNVASGNPVSGGGGVKATFSTGPIIEVRGNQFFDNEASFAGGAISAFASDMHIIDNTIIGNGNGRFGGGIHLESLVGSGGDREFLITDNRIEDNYILNVAITGLDPAFDKVSGAGLHLNFGVAPNFTSSTVEIRNNIIRNNAASDSRCTDGVSSFNCSYGGGIVFFNARPALQIVADNLIEGNIADVYAAANFDKVQLDFRDNRVLSNRARFTHPGVGCVSNNAANATTCQIRRNRFIDNRYTGSGTGSGQANDSGALNIRFNSTQVVNNLFANNFGNLATVFARHEDAPGAVTNFHHNTVVSNGTQNAGFAALMVRGDSNIRNNIFHDDRRAFRIQDYSAVSITGNNITAMSTAVGRDGTTNINTVADLNARPDANGNTALSPGFNNAGSGDYRLGNNSPLIDLVSCISGINDDLDGNARPNGSNCEPGAFEHYELPIFTDRFES